jgi:hypothetical protein
MLILPPSPRAAILSREQKNGALARHACGHIELVAVQISTLDNFRLNKGTIGLCLDEKTLNKKFRWGEKAGVTHEELLYGLTLDTTDHRSVRHAETRGYELSTGTRTRTRTYGTGTRTSTVWILYR